MSPCLCGMLINTLSDAEHTTLQQVLERIFRENGMPQPVDQASD